MLFFLNHLRFYKGEALGVASIIIIITIVIYHFMKDFPLLGVKCIVSDVIAEGCVTTDG